LFEASPFEKPVNVERVWGVGPLMRAIADTLSARFNPVKVEGEISGFSRAASGHCYFSLKDDSGQIRCAMFRRSADQLAFVPKDGQRVQASGKIDVYGPRGDLQLIVDRLDVAGQGTWYERFLRLKAQLEAEGLFDAARKRPLPAHPLRVGVVTSLGAAALRDVCTALQRRAPHISVVIYPASVQGVQAPAELCAALQTAYARHHSHGECDVLLLVRGGGSLEDLWAFNDEAVVRTVVQAPMPLICGVGHETDFSLCDFAADLRAPTPTAAAELCAAPRSQRLAELSYLNERLTVSLQEGLDLRAQRLDRLTQHLGRPSGRVQASHQRLVVLGHQLQRSVASKTQNQGHRLGALEQTLPVALRRSLQRQQDRWQRSQAALNLLDPRLVLERGYAWLTDAEGRALSSVADFQAEQAVTATLADGSVGLRVQNPPSA
jgi:exodeoxyribonuclease VII large subunit